MEHDGHSGQEDPDWARHEDEIHHLFVSQNKTLNQVMSHMSKKHNFKATARQYKRRFPKLKNVRSDEWIWIDQQIQLRAAAGKKSEPCLLNRPLPPSRVTRETKRHRLKTRNTILASQLPNPSPGRISVRTPPLEASVLRVNPPLDTWVEPPRLQGPSNIQPHFRKDPFDVQFDLGEMSQLGAMEIGAHIDDNIEWIYSPGALSLNADGRANQTMTSLQPSTVMSGDSFSFRPPGTLSPQSSGRTLSPFAQPLNLGVFDTRPGFHLVANLPWFRLQNSLNQLAPTSLQRNPTRDMFGQSPTTSGALLPKIRQGVLLSLLGYTSTHPPEVDEQMIKNKLQSLIPGRYEGELSQKIAHILDPSSTSTSALYAIFSLAAYFSSNNKLEPGPMDAFLRWVVDQKYTGHLLRFLQIKTPTIRAFTPQILKSTFRLGYPNLLAAILDLDVKIDRILDEVLEIFHQNCLKVSRERFFKFDRTLDEVPQIVDEDCMKIALERFKPTIFQGNEGTRLFHEFINYKYFNLARMLVAKGVSVDAITHKMTPLYAAVHRRNIVGAMFLLELGADVNKVSCSAGLLQATFTPLAEAAYSKDSDMVSLLLKHNANTSCNVGRESLMNWCRMNCRDIYIILQKHMGVSNEIATVEDMLDAANESEESFRAYLEAHKEMASRENLENALVKSILPGYLKATTTLLDHGVSPNLPWGCVSPLQKALGLHGSDFPLEELHNFCKLLIGYGADVNQQDVFLEVIDTEDLELLRMFVNAGVDFEKQGMRALVRAAEVGNVSSAALLLGSVVRLDTPGILTNLLQPALHFYELEMLEFLVARGADTNLLRNEANGLTLLQEALNEGCIACAWALLEREADIFAPPASLMGGLTALEAVCHSEGGDTESLQDLCDYLLDCNAPVNRPNENPSSALHGAIEEGWDGVVARMLEPQRHAVINHMWCKNMMEGNKGFIKEARTPTQLAAERGRSEAVKMLLARGADVNEAPAWRFGRTTLQAATSRDELDMDIVQFLLDQGADINAKPALHGGITAIQGAAISGHIMLAKLLIDKGADVNGHPADVDGRYAIEGAAEHGRLDMVQFLLNVGAKGNVRNGSGFEEAINLAKKRKHFVIAELLETAGIFKV